MSKTAYRKSAVSRGESEIQLSKIAEIIPAIKGGYLGSRVELVYLTNRTWPQLKGVGESLKLLPQLFSYKTVVGSDKELLGVAATLRDECWLTERGRSYLQVELNQLITEARLMGLKEIRSLASDRLYQCQTGVSVLLAIDEKIPKEELLGVIELLHACGSKHIVPLISRNQTEVVKTLSQRFKQIIDISE